MSLHFVEKVKESAVSVIPIMGIVVLLHFTIAPLQDGQLAQFLLGGVLLILGLSVFLIGADLGMIPFGQRVGSYLTHKRSLLLMLFASFIIGFAITIAEPDVQVLAKQVSSIMPGIGKQMLLAMIAVGVGIFLMVGTGRIVLQWSLRSLLILFYLAVFGVCAFVEPAFVGIAFDSGGATTGPITVPFIIALGVGVASAVKNGDDNSFGLVGLASIGPVAAVALMGLFDKTGMNVDGAGAGGAVIVPDSVLERFAAIVPDITHEIFMALWPLLVIFVICQLLFLRMPAQQVKRMVLGFIYTFIGLVVFMTGVSGGFSPVGQSLGQALGSFWDGNALVPIGLVLGAVVVCAEPAVWVLTAQIEEVSGGHIRRSIMLAALSISIAVAVALGMIRIVTGIGIFWFLIPGYALALIMTKFCSPLFTAIAFDSGGVASGPMSTTFVLSLGLGASMAVGGNPTTDAFGMIAMIAMAPLITIQLLGVVLRIKEKQALKKEQLRKQER